MTKFTIRLTVAGALAASILGASAGSASAASVGTPHAPTRVVVRPHAPRSTDGEVCSDWTNEDGSHGTNCPGGGWGWWKMGGDTNPPQEGVGDG